jgi:hypothetical protein
MSAICLHAKRVTPPQQDNYLVDYKNVAFTMPGDGCQYSNEGDSSGVSFTQQGPIVTVADVNGADMDVDCGLDAPTLGFNDQTALVTGSPSPARCANTTDLMPIADRLDLRQLAPGDELCFIAGGGSTPHYVVLATLVAVVGSLSYNTTWIATMWQTSPQATTR